MSAPLVAGMEALTFISSPLVADIKDLTRVLLFLQM